MYLGKLATWKEQLYRNGQIASEDRRIFDAFCENLRSAALEQSFTFHGSVLTGGYREDAYRVRFLPRQLTDGKHVLGSWGILNEMTGEVLENYTDESHIDPLTRVLNKKSITEHVEKRCLEEKNKTMALIVIDIDNFKGVNDSFGHMFGDQVISAVADVIKNTIGKHGVAGRIGGDEFMILLEDCDTEVILRNYLRGIRTGVCMLFQEKLMNERLSCSIGAARSPLNATEYKVLFKIADYALFIAKKKGKNRFIIYKPEMHGEIRQIDECTDMIGIRDSFYTEKDLYEINRLLRLLIMEGRGVLSDLLEQTAKTLMVDRISVFWRDGNTPMAVNPLADKGKPSSVMIEPEYIGMFSDDMYVTSNVWLLENSQPKLYGEFQEAEICGTMQHLLRDAEGRVCGIVTADDCKNIHSFPKVAEHIFENLCEVVNAVLCREDS